MKKLFEPPGTGGKTKLFCSSGGTRTRTRTWGARTRITRLSEAIITFSMTSQHQQQRHKQQAKKQVVSFLLLLITCHSSFIITMVCGHTVPDATTVSYYYYVHR